MFASIIPNNDFASEPIPFQSSSLLVGSLQ